MWKWVLWFLCIPSEEDNSTYVEDNTIDEDKIITLNEIHDVGHDDT